MPNVISNTSPLQYLYQANLLDLLPQIYHSIVVTQSVNRELEQGRILFGGFSAGINISVLD